MDPRAAGEAIVMFDSHGLVHTDRPDVPDDQRPFAVDPAPLMSAGLSPSDLADPVAVARVTATTVLIGASACSGAFSEGLVREVALHDPAPIMLPLSNPGACAEARPEDLLAWTGGRALVAAGGPSREVAGPGGVRVIGQANNVFIFPGLGLGAIVAQTREVTDEMFLVAAHQLADLVSEERLRTGALYPPVAGLRAVARAIAIAVTRTARDDGRGLPLSDPEIEAAIDRTMWWPDYVPVEPGH
jgi:malic enzyme